MAKLTDLSPEIVTLIAEELNGWTGEIYQFRLTCRYLSRCSQKVFIEWYVSLCCANLTRKGLLQFLEIAKTPDLGPFIEELQLVMSPKRSNGWDSGSSPCFSNRSTSRSISDIPRNDFNRLALPEGSPSDTEDRPSHTEDPPSDTEGPLSNIGELPEQDLFYRSALDISYLIQILQHSINCKEITLDMTNGNSATWDEETSVNSLDDNQNHIGHVVYMTLAALAGSNSQITSLKVAIQDGGSLQPISLSLPESFLDPKLPWINSLKTLYLAIGPGGLEYSDHWAELPAIPAGAGDHDVWCKPLANFVNLFPGLESLNLVFSDRLESDYFNALVPMLTPLKIHTLALGYCDCRPGDLLGFLRLCSPSLQSLTLYGVSLEGSWRPVLATIRDEFALASFAMSECRENMIEELTFKEGDLKRSTSFSLVGRDPSLWDRLDRGLKLSSVPPIAPPVDMYVRHVIS
ncbi:hypothetical protein N7454_001059 [Penicillium verhagenii]|nr:hypothetical protein N7454_001059 [Penicillium verhagenii]